MSRDSVTLSRRRLLASTTGSALGLAGLTTTTSATGRGNVTVNVGFASQAGERAVQRAATSVERAFAFDAVTVTVPESAVDGLRRRGDVRYVERDATIQTLGDTETDGGVTTQSQSLPWGVDRIDAEVAHAAGYTGTGADLAVIDTGIDADHPDLQPNLGTGRAFVSCQGQCAAPWDDDNGHGTYVAGIAGAVDDAGGVVGVAPDVTLHSVKVLDRYGAGTYSDIASGIQYVAQQGWDVANMSFGAASSSLVLYDAVRYAADAGVTMVAAGGGSDVGYPAAYDEVIATSGTDRYDNLASFSSTGPQIELAAPGVDIPSTAVGGGTETRSGDSATAPHAAAAAALLAGTGASRSSIRSTLRSTAENLGLPSNQQGYGLVDAAAALGLNSSDNL